MSKRTKPPEHSADTVAGNHLFNFISRDFIGTSMVYCLTSSRMVILKLVQLLRKMQVLFEAKLITISGKVQFMKNKTHYTESSKSGTNILNA
jgi:hypothetical protein